ncbi:hypothetical protein ACQ4M3_29595 [Leptolyngbya sp. AN03gr2]|uniref:hypothetical protein n=1 Tax=unclassified Leptolyngbya TaxID=2650499 RepID=UPI003D321EB8
MLVVLAGDQLLSVRQVCQGCLMADQSGQPRWRQGQLRCGQAISQMEEKLPAQFECQMGFRIANIE